MAPPPLLPALPVEDVEALPPCGLAPPPLLVPLLPDEPLACEPELEPPPLADDPLSRELEPPPLPLLEDEALSCVLEPPPPLPPLEDEALSCELEPPPLLPLLPLPLLLPLLLEDEELSCELEPPPPLLLLLEAGALSCGLSEAPGWAATAGLPPNRASASSAENVTSHTVLLTTTLGTRWS